MSSPATKDALNALHAEVAKTLTARIKDGTATAADIQAAIKFLKDNNIEALAVPGSPTAGLAGALTDSLPFAGSDHQSH
jgi:hypothetical protein